MRARLAGRGDKRSVNGVARHWGLAILGLIWQGLVSAGDGMVWAELHGGSSNRRCSGLVSGCGLAENSSLWL